MIDYGNTARSYTRILKLEDIDPEDITMTVETLIDGEEELVVELEDDVVVEEETPEENEQLQEEC